MTKEQEKKYLDADSLRKLLSKTLKGKKFRLDCGHHVTFGSTLGNDVMIRNGKEIVLTCSLCSY